jgi:hypothetical protein
MAIVETKRACERRLQTLTPSVPTAYEGVTFTPPNTMYQKVQFVISQPDDPVLGTGYYRERLQMQVFIVDETNKGTSGAIQRAELIRGLFPKGLTITEGAFRIYVLSTPQIAGSTQATNRTIVPVLIDLVTEVYS